MTVRIIDLGSDYEFTFAGSVFAARTWCENMNAVGGCYAVMICGVWA